MDDQVASLRDAAREVVFLAEGTHNLGPGWRECDFDAACGPGAVAPR